MAATQVPESHLSDLGDLSRVVKELFGLITEKAMIAPTVSPEGTPPRTEPLFFPKGIELIDLELTFTPQKPEFGIKVHVRGPNAKPVVEAVTEGIPDIPDTP